MTPETLSKKTKKVEFVSKVLGSVVSLLIIAGLPFTAYEYLLSRNDERIEKSLELLNIWEDTGYRNDYILLQTTISDYFESLSEQQLKTIKLMSPEEIAHLKRKVGSTLAKNTITSERVEKLNDFFSRLAICAEERICSRSFIYKQFDSAIKSYWAYFESYLINKRNLGIQDYAIFTEKLAIDNLRPRWYFLFD